ncbi:hypothetical protein LCGC14_0784330 [marine sediment metagenome]|uniref:Uncharacterized protein n=1 Tax=marine sediment metagenome TaxID=412755 RepID=A0A0F9PYR1_9ZZZZ|nr:hypothetical protein [Phycisphaerae bacterium]
MKASDEATPGLDAATVLPWALDMCSLLDAVSLAISREEYARAKVLLYGRFALAESYGIEVYRGAPASQGDH